MKHRAARFALAAGMLLFGPLPSFAQLSWESPQLLGPGSPAGVSILFVNYGLDPNPGLGGTVIWRTATAPRGFALRGSVAQGIGNKLNYAGGIDLSSTLMRASSEFPFSLMWTYGAGASYGEYLEVALPIGVAGGRTIASSKMRFSPYTGARGVLEGRIGSAAPGRDLGVGFAIDLGADLAFGQNRDFAIRLAASIGDRHAAAIGVHFGGGTSAVSAQRAPISRR
ncbi:MAG TPA: hypothetical protein VK864_03940 [Longimicrobiales bacterium]|nr:hypothetical protein [Longimicrobiales bacterium]